MPEPPRTKPTLPGAIGPADREVPVALALLTGALVVGLATAADYGVSIDEFNADDYGVKALAWYTSGFTDRSHFETVEFSLWYYGPWFQMLIAFVQSFELADRFVVRHAMTFLVGLAGLAALLPIGRLTARPWSGLAAIALCLMTGYLYGSLFSTPIDVPFLAAMTWATLAIIVMARRVLPSWRATLAVGLTTGLAIATRTGGIITQAYLLGALALCAVDFFALNGRLTGRYLLQLAARYAAAAAIAVTFAVALWPWLQVGNPLTHFWTAYRHFGAMQLSYAFAHWGDRVRTDALPFFYIPEQFAARLPEVFLLLLALAGAQGVLGIVRYARRGPAARPAHHRSDWQAPAMALASNRGFLVVVAAVALPLGFLILQRTRVYDGVRHILFVIPMLAAVAGGAFALLLPSLRRLQLPFAVVTGLVVGNTVMNLARLHPLEYVAMNALAGGTRGAYQRFELDYLALAATEALRRLESRQAYEPQGARADAPAPTVLVCIPWREQMVEPLLRRPWTLETDVAKADYVIETERSRCAQGQGLQLIDEVKRAGRSFAWTYARQR